MAKRPVSIAAVVILVAGAALGLALGRPWEPTLRSDADPAARSEASDAIRAAGTEPRAGDRATLARTPGGAGTPAPAAEAAPPPVDFAKLDRALDLHGTVVDGTGSPIANADLVAVTYPFRRAEILAFDHDDEAVLGPRTKSATDGSFAIRLTREASVGLRVAAKGFPPIERPGCRAGERVKIVLKPGVTLVIEAVDESGKPAAGAAFRLFRPDHHGEFTFDRTGVAGIDGRLRLEDLPAGATAYLDSAACAYGDFGWKDVTLPESGEAVFHVALPAGRTITGRVTDAETKAPIAGARVGMNWDLHRGVATDSDGRYALAGWTGNGIDDIQVLAADHGRSVAVVGGRTVIDFVLEKGDSVSGRIVASDGAPIAGATLGVVASVFRDGHQTTSSAAGTSGPDGRFSLGGLRHDMPHTLVAMAPGFGRTLTDFDPLPDGRGTIDVGDVRLPPARTLSGRALTSDGAPVAKARVELRGANADRGRMRTGKEALDEYYGSSRDESTDDLGRFGFADLAPGTYSLKITSEGMPTQRAAVALRADGEPAEFVVTFPAGRPFRIVVEDTEGKPIPWAWFQVVDRGPTGSDAHGLDKEGKASFQLSPTATAVRVFCFGDDADERRFLPFQKDFPIDPNAEVLHCAMTRGATLHGRVVGLDGAPVPFAGLQVMVGGEVLSWDHADDGGRFDVTVPFEGTATLRLDGTQGSGQRGQPKDIAISGELVVKLPGGKDLVLSAHPRAADRRQVVHVFDPDGRPTEGVKVWAAWAQDAAKSAEGVTDAGGRVELAGLPDSPCTWSLGTLPDPTWLSHAYRTDMPGAGPVELRLRRALKLHGRVKAPPGVDASTARVMVMQGDHFGASTTVAAADLSFTLMLDPLNGDTVSLEATLGPEGAMTHRVRVEGVRLDGAEIVLALEPVK